MSRKQRELGLWCLLAGVAPVANADDVLESVVVTGAYAPIIAADLTASVSVLDETILSALNKRSVADVLRSVPGLLVEEQGGVGGLTAVSVRGGESNFTLVMVDGVALNDPTNSRGGSYDFNNLDPATVQRIEVVRGAQSAVYGSDALAGVINIITRRAPEGHRQSVRIEGGENGYTDYRVNLAGSAGQVGYVIDLAQRDSGEQVPGSQRDIDSANLRLTWQPALGHELSVAYRYLDGARSSFPEQSGGPQFAVTDALDESDYREETLAFSWQAQLMPRWQSRLSADRFDLSEDYRSPGIAPFGEVPPNAADTDYQRDQLRWVNSLQLHADYRLSLGADYRDEKGDSLGFLEFGGVQLPTDFALDRATTGLFLELSARPLEQLTLQGSLRHDDPDGFDAETTARLGARYTLNTAWQVFGNWGEAFKLPSFFALGHPLVGNPALRPETAESWDLGATWTPSSRVDLTLAGFANDYEDLIDFDDALFVNVNRDRVESRGAELELRWQARPDLELRGQATYVDLEVVGESRRLLGRPEWKAGLIGLWQVSAAWDTSLDYQWTGEQYASSRHTGESVVEPLNDIHRLDWRLRWRALPRLSLELAVDNLLDEDYENAVGFPGPGRNVRFAVSLSNE
ncbi:MAG: TonB-dependent receptor [Pseudomonadota bacterium]